MQCILNLVKSLVWCGFIETKIIGPYFFEDADGRSISDHRQIQLHASKCYISCFELYFQQDVADRQPDSIFPGRLIFRLGDIAWPARNMVALSELFEYIFWSHRFESPCITSTYQYFILFFNLSARKYRI